MKKIFIIIFLTLTAAFTPIAGKYVVNYFPPLSYPYFRFGIATLLLLIVIMFRKVNLKIDRKDYPMFLLLGVLVIPINQFCFLEGLSFSEASHSGVLYACTPLLVYLISIKNKYEKFNTKKFLSILLTIAGIGIIFYENIITPGKPGANYMLGDILLFMAVASWSAYLALSQKFVFKYGALKTQTVSFVIGMILYTPIFLFDMKNINWSVVNPGVLLASFHLTILVAFGGYFLYSYSANVIKPSTLTTMTNTSPIVTIFFSWLLLKEYLSYFFILGALITMLGVFISQRIGEN